MKKLAEFLVRKPVAWTVVVVSLLLTIASAFFAARVVQDDDVLAFLPRGNPDVATFYEIADRYGSLDVALVGIESADVYAGDFVDRLQRATKQLNVTEGIELGLSLTNVEDFVADPQRGGITSDYLIREVPADAEQAVALRNKVTTRDHVIGNLVSSDGKSVMVYAFAKPGVQPRVTATNVRDVIERFFPLEKKHFYGSPFIASYIYDATQADLKHLAPWACLAITLVILISFRDLVGVGLSLFTTLAGIVIPLGVMGILGIRTNIVLGSMPVILFALGSAYGIHLLSRFYRYLPGNTRELAVQRALVEVGPAIFGSGITTVFGLLSFVLMDIKPLRTFGFFSAFGLLVALLLALVFLPVVVTLTPVGSRRLAAGHAAVHSRSTIATWTHALSSFVMRKRAATSLVMGIVAAVAVYFVGRVDSRLDTTAFFAPGSPPSEAERLMRDKFGGSTFLQLEIAGDMTEPVVLREVQHLADRISTLTGVSGVTQVAEIVALTNEAMEDVRRIPDSKEKVRLLFSFLTGKRAVDSTVTEDRGAALLHIKLSVSSALDVERVLRDVEQLTSTVLPQAYAVVDGSDVKARERRVELVRDRMVSIGRGFGATNIRVDALTQALRTQKPKPVLADVQAKIAAFLRTEAFGVPLPNNGPEVETLAARIAALGEPPANDDDLKRYKSAFPMAVADALKRPISDSVVDDASLSLEQSAVDIWRAAAAAAYEQAVLAESGFPIAVGSHGERLRVRLRHALLDMEAPSVLEPRSADSGAFTGTLRARVTGTPVLYRGLSASVFNNQWNSLWFAMVIVVLLKTVVFRSLLAGLLSSIPTLFTLLVVYGAMGLFGLHLDIGTSMLASLIIGAGDDYAVEYLWAWLAPAGSPLASAAQVAADATAPAIWTNALTMAIGFFVLTLGESRPLQNVGGLTATAMLIAAVSTFALCPLLARRRRYAPDRDDAKLV